MFKQALVISCGLLILSGAASASFDDLKGESFYVSVGAGKAKPNNISNSNLPFVSKVDIKMTEDKELGLRFKQGTRVRGALGLQCENYRTELEFSHLKTSHAKMSSGHGKYRFPAEYFRGFSVLNSVLINVFYDFHSVNEMVAPFIGAGIGLSKINNTIQVTHTIGNVSGKTTEKKLSGQLSAGLKFKVSDLASVLIDYRLFATNKTKALEHRFQDQSLNLGLMLRF